VIPETGQFTPSADVALAASLSPPERSIARRWAALAIALAANLAIIILLGWSLTERLHVVVTVVGDTATAQIGDVVLAAPVGSHPAGQVGLFLQGSDPQAAIFWSPGAPRPTSSAVTSALYRLGTESAWENVKILRLADGNTEYDQSQPASGAAGGGPTPLFGDWFRYPLGGLASSAPGLTMIGQPDWTGYQVEADLLRPRNAAGVFVLSPDGSNGMLFYFRPENRDVMWYDVQNGQWTGPVATAPYLAFRKEPLAAVQDVVRLLLGGYPVALGFLALVLAAGTVERRLRAGRSREAGTRLAVHEYDAAGIYVWHDRLANLLVAGLAVAGLGVTLYIASALLQRMPHVQDSVAYLFQAKTFALGRLWVPTPAHPEFFTHEFVVMDKAGRWFSKYSPGWPGVLALGVLAGAPWAVDPICGALSLFLLYRIGKEWFSTRVGLLAAVLGLSAPFFLFLSGSMMAHTSGLFFTLLMLWSFGRATRSARPLAWSIATGAAFGMVFLVRPWSAILVALPIGSYALIVIARQPRQGLARFLPAAAAAVPFAAAFLAYNKVFTGNWFYPTQQLWWPFDQLGFGPNNGPWGFYPVDGLNNTSRNLLELLTHGFGWPAFATLSLALVPFLARRATRWDWLCLAGFVAIVAGYAAWWADGIMYGPRFYYEGFGYLIVLTARGVDVGLDLARDRFSPESGRAVVAPVLVYAFLVALVGFNLWYYLPGQWTLYYGYNYVSHAKLDAVAAANLHNALVFADVGKPYEWWEYGEVFSANDPSLSGDVIFARDLGDAADQKLIADFPHRSYYRLDGTTITPLDFASVRQQADGRQTPGRRGDAGL
jgi:hypothetical protein